MPGNADIGAVYGNCMTRADVGWLAGYAIGSIVSFAWLK